MRSPMPPDFWLVDAAHAVPTEVLASELYRGASDEAPEATLIGRDHLARMLRGRARGELEAYANREPGKPIMWCLP